MSDETPLPDGFESITVTANGTRLHAVVGGSGAPVLLLHGWPQTWRAWRPLMPVLAAHGHRVIAPDLRGTGGSDRPPSGDDKDTHAGAGGPRPPPPGGPGRGARRRGGTAGVG